MMRREASSFDGTRIVYHQIGSGAPVLLVHGTLATTAMYEPIAKSLSRHYQVLLMERRGYGVSEDGERPGTLDAQALDIAAVLDAVGEPSYLFGHSAGGLVALQALPDTADRVRALALYEPPVALRGARLRPVLEQCRRLASEGRDMDAAVAFLSSIGSPDPSLRRIASMLAHRVCGLIEDLECITSMSDEPGRWSASGTPILLLAGSESDRYAKQSIAVLQHELPASDTVVLAGQGHHPDDAGPVAAALHTFFSAH
jgi:pimeloyl-ACP methyl ester carboxylesterase